MNRRGFLAAALAVPAAALAKLVVLHCGGIIPADWQARAPLMAFPGNFDAEGAALLEIDRAMRSFWASASLQPTVIWIDEDAAESLAKLAETKLPRRMPPPSPRPKYTSPPPAQGARRAVSLERTPERAAGAPAEGGAA